MIRPIRNLLLFGAALVSILSFAGAQENQIKKTPVKRTTSVSGEQLFKQYCAVCHGPGGNGDGPVASALKVAKIEGSVVVGNGQPSFRRSDHSANRIFVNVVHLKYTSGATLNLETCHAATISGLGRLRATRKIKPGPRISIRADKLQSVVPRVPERRPDEPLLIAAQPFEWCISRAKGSPA